MDLIDDLLSKRPTTTIFHYTSPSGLLGIIESKSIWATNLHYLNDRAEFVHAIHTAELELQHARKKVTSTTEAAFLDRLNNELKSLEGIPIYVSSFSEEGDLLSQWRAYCPNGNGFSIGFEYPQLEPLLKRQSFSLHLCIYDHELQHSIIKELIDETLTQFRSFQARPDSSASSVECTLLQTFNYRFVEVGPCLKHPAFSEEKEWRMISWPIRDDHPQIRHREGRSMIIPYFEFKLAEEDEKLALSEVIIGPTPHPGLSRNSVISLLRSMSVLASYSVKLSKVPYRGW